MDPNESDRRIPSARPTGTPIAVRIRMWKHWTVRTSTPYEPFRDFESAQWFWDHLSSRFPNALGAVLMPNHLHLLLPFSSTASEIQDRAILTGLMSALSKKLHVSGLWQPFREPSLISDRFHLRRNLRYVALNPCRKALCSDPLEWPWSTYRDLFGSSVNQWITVSRVAHALGEKENDFERRFHEYVSSDPTVALEGTPLPKATSPKILAEEGIIEILTATSAAFRLSATEVKQKGPLRNVFVHLAYRQGWRQPAVLAGICGITPRAIRSIIHEPPLRGIQEASLCLGDRRLRQLPPFLKEGKLPKSGS